MGNAVSPCVASALGRCLALAAVGWGPSEGGYGGGGAPGDLDHAVVAVPDPVLHEVSFPSIEHEHQTLVEF